MQIASFDGAQGIEVVGVSRRDWGDTDLLRYFSWESLGSMYPVKAVICSNKLKIKLFLEAFSFNPAVVNNVLTTWL
jgi:hypothetical protein